MNRIRRMALAATVAAVAAVPAASPVEAARANIFHGRFQETATGVDHGYNINGVAAMVVSRHGTHVGVFVRGLDPAKTYGSHLHNGTCATGGGGHYQDREGGATTPPNELWITNSAAGLVSHRSGVVVGGGSATWKARTDSVTQTNARSIVIHEPGGARIACADLD